jgi:hypothetical protein
MEGRNAFGDIKTNITSIVDDSRNIVHTHSVLEQQKIASDLITKSARARLHGDILCVFILFFKIGTGHKTNLMHSTNAQIQLFAIPFR